MQATVFVVLLALVLQSWAVPVEETDSANADMMDRLRKMADPPKRTRPVSKMADSQTTTSSKDDSESSTSAPTTTTTTTTALPTTTQPATSTSEPEKQPESPSPSAGKNPNFVLVPITDQNLLGQIQQHVSGFQSQQDPYNQVQVVPLRPPGLAYNNYFQYLPYTRNRQNSIVDRFTNFAGNFFPIEVDVPDLLGSLTSWIPGAQLIGQILTGNRPNSRRFAVLGANGQVYVVDVPDRIFRRPGPNVGMPYPQPHPTPYANYGAPFRPYVNQGPPFNGYLQRTAPPTYPQAYNPGYPNIPYPADYSGVPDPNPNYEYLESRTDDMGPSLNDEVYSGGFENNPNVAILPNQRFNGNLHIPADGVLIHQERTFFPEEGPLYPEGRSLTEPESE